VGIPPYMLRLAMPAEADTIKELVTETAQWLRGKDTDQWATPWPDATGRDKRIEDDVLDGHTWIVWDDDICAGTISLDLRYPLDAEANPVWPVHRLGERALYVHRVVVRRCYKGQGLGAGLLDWASAKAVDLIGKPLLRVDVWTSNSALHKYYMAKGFDRCGYREPDELPNYPARALFERRISPNGHSTAKYLFYEDEDPLSLSGAVMR